MRGPGGLQVALGMGAEAQREPDAILDRIEIERLTNPGLTRRRAANRKDAGGSLALLVVGDRRLLVFAVHFAAPDPKSDAKSVVERAGNGDFVARQLYPGNIS